MAPLRVWRQDLICAGPPKSIISLSSPCRERFRASYGPLSSLRAFPFDKMKLAVTRLGSFGGKAGDISFPA